MTPFSEGLFGSVVLPPSVEFEGFEPFEGFEVLLPEPLLSEPLPELLPLEPLLLPELPESLPLPEPLPDPPLSVGSVVSV